MNFYITVTKSDGIIHGIGTTLYESVHDAEQWTDDRDFESYLCGVTLYCMSVMHGGDAMYYIDEFGTAQFNGVRT